MMKSTDGHNFLGEVCDSHSHNEPAPGVRIIENCHDMGVRILAVARVCAVHHEIPKDIVRSGDLLVVGKVRKVGIRLDPTLDQLIDVGELSLVSGSRINFARVRNQCH